MLRNTAPVATLARLLAVCCACLGLTAGAASADSGSATLTVDARTQLGTVPDGAAGVNAMTWNPHLMDAITPLRLQEAKIRTLAWHLGPATDLYDWQTNTLRPDPEPAGRPWGFAIDGPFMTPKYTFDDFAARAQQADAEMLVHINYGTGTPEEAAAWVRYANRDRRYGVKRWEIGEEQWINGFTGLPFMPDARPDKSPTAYANDALAFMRAMKAVDPTIEVGIGIAPAAPDGSAYWRWNQTVISIVRSQVDFVDYHYYTPTPNDATLLMRPTTAPRTVARLRGLLDANTAPGDHVDLVIGEANSNVTATLQTTSIVNALFLADFGATLLESGVAAFDWYTLHNGTQGGTSPGASDLGLLSSGECSGSVCQPPAGTPFPAFYGMRLLNTTLHPSDKMLQTSSSDPLVAGHVVRKPDGDLVALLINKSPTTAYETQIQTPGYDVRDLRGIESYDAVNGLTDADGFRSCPGQPVTLAPYSLTVVQLSKQDQPGWWHLGCDG